MIDIGATNPAVLILSGVAVPVAGETARAGDIRALAQILLNNDAFLANRPAVSFEFALPEALAEGAVYTINVPDMPSVGAVLRVMGGASRVIVATRPGNFQRPPFMAPENWEMVMVDVSLGQYGGTLYLDRPALFAREQTGAVVSVQAYADLPAGTAFKVHYLPLGSWVSTDIFPV